MIVTFSGYTHICLNKQIKGLDLHSVASEAISSLLTLLSTILNIICTQRTIRFPYILLVAMAVIWLCGDDITSCKLILLLCYYIYHFLAK